jgi:hypothetical protein
MTSKGPSPRGRCHSSNMKPGRISVGTENLKSFKGIENAMQACTFCEGSKMYSAYNLSQILIICASCKEVLYVRKKGI